MPSRATAQHGYVRQVPTLTNLPSVCQGAGTVADALALTRLSMPARDCTIQTWDQISSLGNRGELNGRVLGFEFRSCSGRWSENKGRHRHFVTGSYQIGERLTWMASFNRGGAEGRRWESPPGSSSHQWKYKLHNRARHLCGLSVWSP